MFHSYDSQDFFLEFSVFLNHQNGFFVDVGASNGIDGNNTLYFEKENNWKGINIEANPIVFEKLKQNRPSTINLNFAICDEFICCEGYTLELSGLKAHYDPRHLNRIDYENKTIGGTYDVINVQTRRLQTICKQHNITHINYLSIDVEGAEFDVIKSINFKEVFIDVVGFENNFEETSIKIIRFLMNLGFVCIYKNLDIFMIHTNSVFYVDCPDKKIDIDYLFTF